MIPAQIAYYDQLRVLSDVRWTALLPLGLLSFLGLGVKDGVSWGLMISESTQDVLAGHFNNFASSSIFLFVLVIAFNMFSDSMQDALDPKKVS